ncbi:MAG TPA: hypothetical protein VHY75_16415 [Steroidobacteraceae bacterium]|jgi:hypothetical protein|nr:hypothetical protein [Steroidobacteraceae bacterium]
MGKSMDTDLLPWILGAALLASGAIGAAIHWTDHAAHGPPPLAAAPAPSAALASTAAPSPTATPSPTAAAAAPATPLVAPSGSAVIDAAPAVAAVPAPTARPSADDPELPSGQVWECVVNGQKVFSDRRCGRDAAVKQLGNLNTMEVPAAVPGNPYGPYHPAYGGAAYPPPSAQDDPDDYGDTAGDSYPSPLYLAARDRAREHRRHHDDHVRRPASSHGAVGARSLH